MDTRRDSKTDEYNFGMCELQYGRDILKALEATDLRVVDKDALAGTLKAVNSHLSNAKSSLE